MDSLISVIIPVYNTEQYLSRCLDSVIASDYRNLEVICIDDGSTDNSLMVLREYATKDDRIKVVDVPNGGVSKARNIGLDQANGEYITFIDSDDWIHKAFFNILVNCIEIYKVDIAVCHFIRNVRFSQANIVSADALPKIHNGKSGLESHTIKSYIGGHVYKRNLLLNHHFDENVKISEDTLFNIELFANNPNIKTVLIDIELYYYNNRHGSAMNTCNGLDFKSLSYIYLDRVEQADDKYVAGIYLNDAFKNTFAVRYLTRMTAEKQLKGEICELLKRCLQIEKTKKPLPFKKAFVYKLMSHFPIIYTLFRRVKER